MSHRSRIAAFCLTLALPQMGIAQSIDWKEVFYDPGKSRHGAADLILPMPCGGAMAFQRIDVPVEAANILSDKRLRLGQSGTESGYSEYLRFAHLRGAFDDRDDARTTYYYMARYELNDAQFKALTDSDCATPRGKDRLTKTGVSWFDALQLSKTYTEWLRQSDVALPARGEAKSFVRLPTETEWEYATRGGSATDQASFGAPAFDMPEGVEAYARVQGIDGNVSRAGPPGVLLPNPEGLFDVYGNAEELVLEPFRLNAVGRAHGQVGGIVTRGGSYLDSAGQMYSARRVEWPLYSQISGKAQSQDSFGIRFVVTAHVNESDQFVRELQNQWTERLDGPAEATRTPDQDLALLAEDELDPARRVRIESIQHALRVKDDALRQSNDAVLRAQLFAGTVTIMSIRDDTAWLPRAEIYVNEVQKYLDDFDDIPADERQQFMDEIAKTSGDISNRQSRLNASLQTYVAVLETLSDPAMSPRIAPVSDVLITELTQSAQENLIPTVESLLIDLEDFSRRPDLSRAAIISLAVE